MPAVGLRSRVGARPCIAAEKIAVGTRFRTPPTSTSPRSGPDTTVNYPLLVPRANP